MRIRTLAFFLFRAALRGELLDDLSIILKDGLSDINCLVIMI